jgi:hypothetical protein
VGKGERDSFEAEKERRGTPSGKGGRIEDAERFTGSPDNSGIRKKVPASEVEQLTLRHPKKASRDSIKRAPVGREAQKGRRGRETRTSVRA